MSTTTEETKPTGLFNNGFFKRMAQGVGNGAGATFNKDQMWIFYPEEKEKTYHTAPLYNLLLDLQVHFDNGRFSLCNTAYSDSHGECGECVKINSYGNANLPQSVMAYLSYIFELDGQTKKSKKGKEYEVNPEQIVQVSSGKKKVNFAELTEAFNNQIFMEEVWKIKRLTDGGIAPPVPANQKSLGKQLDVKKAKPHVEKYQDKPIGEIVGVILSGYQNVKVGHQDFVEAGVVFPSWMIEQQERLADQASRNPMEIDNITTQEEGQAVLSSMDSLDGE